MSGPSNYPPGVTGHDEQIAGAPEVPPDAFVDGLLTSEERLTILRSLRGTKLHGAHVRDVLTILYDSDMWIEKLEPIAEAHAAAWTPEHAYAGLLVGLLSGPWSIGWAEISGFLERANEEIYEEEPEAETVSFYSVDGMAGLGSHSGRIVSVATCGKCCALIVEDHDHANREQHAREAHGLHARF